MKIMTCPLNGPRNIAEFVSGGEVENLPDPASASVREWADYVFMPNNTKGVIREWWMHVPTAFWFIAERDTGTDEILRTYTADTIFSTRVEFTRPDDDP